MCFTILGEDKKFNLNMFSRGKRSCNKVCASLVCQAKNYPETLMVNYKCSCGKSKICQDCHSKSQDYCSDTCFDISVSLRIYFCLDFINLTNIQSTYFYSKMPSLENKQLVDAGNVHATLMDIE